VPTDRFSAASTTECPDCQGHGWYVTTGTEWVYGCCGHYTARGECCENPELFPEPVPEQTPCERCNMTGRVGQVTT
jgi:hypothetical protein